MAKCRVIHYPYSEKTLLLVKNTTFWRQDVEAQKALFWPFLFLSTKAILRLPSLLLGGGSKVKKAVIMFIPDFPWIVLGPWLLSLWKSGIWQWEKGKLVEKAAAASALPSVAVIQIYMGQNLPIQRDPAVEQASKKKSRNQSGHTMCETLCYYISRLNCKEVNWLGTI